ncbi:MAG: sulfite exporter TauE/SafE family protein [Lachnospiraceae bacterium]|nr:sulfite exporter TauE/SafE family protein [Lachnospiraceae bacterium]
MSKNVENKARAVIPVEGMLCEACERRVEGAVKKVDGVREAKADCAKNCLTVEYEKPATLDGICKAVRASGYTVAETPHRQGAANHNTLYILVIILGLYVIATQCGLTQVFQRFPTVSEEKVGYAVLFVIGLFTSVHCIAMCGGINLTQSVTGTENAPVRRSLLYNAGRLTGYTLVGGILGLIGEAASVTLRVRGTIGVLAGVFMVLTGVNMLGNFGFLKKLTLKMPEGVTKAAVSFGKRGSFAIGIVNAFMPCGPLQSMQLYAIAAGGFAAGAFSMFFFCLGTIPLMLIIGVTAGFLKKKWKSRMLRVSAVLVLVFGLFMLQNNFALLGISLPVLSESGTTDGSAVTAMVNADGSVQVLSTTLHVNGFDDIVVEAGIPVVWTITADASSLNGCNNAIVIPEYNQQITLQEGENVIEFTPTETGTFTYTCWMGMLKNTITVV